MSQGRMMPKFAAKRLTRSDLSMFAAHFLGGGSAKRSNQKAINLNADVFVGALYPSLLEVPLNAGRFPIDLYVYGPGEYGALNLQRKIIKGAAYKNWRLNGELIYDPEGEEGRFGSLQEGDIAVLGVEGSPWPESMRLALVSRDESTLYSLLDARLSGRSMIALEEGDFTEALKAAGVETAHPFWALGADVELEDFASGISTISTRLLASGRCVDQAQLRRATESAEHVGRVGEEIVDAYLHDELQRGGIKQYVWSSRENAISPFDFEVDWGDGTVRKLEVKSTSGAFSRPFHMSIAEVRSAVASLAYDVLRVSDVDVLTGKGELHLSRDFKGHAEEILTSLENVPLWCSIDGVSIKPEALNDWDSIGVFELSSTEDP